LTDRFFLEEKLNMQKFRFMEDGKPNWTCKKRNFLSYDNAKTSPMDTTVWPE